MKIDSKIIMYSIIFFLLSGIAGGVYFNYQEERKEEQYQQDIVSDPHISASNLVYLASRRLEGEYVSGFIRDLNSKKWVEAGFTPSVSNEGNFMIWINPYNVRVPNYSYDITNPYDSPTKTLDPFKIKTEVTNAWIISKYERVFSWKAVGSGDNGVAFISLHKDRIRIEVHYHDDTFSGVYDYIARSPKTSSDEYISPMIRKLSDLGDRFSEIDPEIIKASFEDFKLYMENHPSTKIEFVFN